jgi:hypothetical protein
VKPIHVIPLANDTTAPPGLDLLEFVAASLARQFDAIGLASRTTKPATRGASPTASVSSLLTPTLPICGAVIVTICPQ